MKNNKKRVLIGIAVFVGIIGLVGCNLWERDDHVPSAPIQGQADRIVNYAQIPEGSAIVSINGEEHQINFVLSEWGAYPYRTWIYAEINEQQGAGKAPGVDQIAVNLQEITFTFSELPAEISDIIIGIKAKGDTEEHYNEIGRYVVQNGLVAIKVSYEDLVTYFGMTHYSIWFQMIGGRNGEGISGNAFIEMKGTLPDDKEVLIKKEVRFGSNPIPVNPVPVSPTCKLSGSASLNEMIAWSVNAASLTAIPDQYCNAIVGNNGSSPITVTFTGGDNPHTTTLTPGTASSTYSFTGNCPASWSISTPCSLNGIANNHQYLVWDVNGDTCSVTHSIEYCSATVVNVGSSPITVSFFGGDNPGTRVINPGDNYGVNSESASNCSLSWCLIQ